MRDDNTQSWDRPDDEQDYLERQAEMVADALARDCGVCGGPLVILGTLGNRRYFRCRNCGLDWSRD